MGPTATVSIRGARPGHGATTITVACRLALAEHCCFDIIELQPYDVVPQTDLAITVIRGPDFSGIQSAVCLPDPDLLVVIAEVGRAVTPEHAAVLVQAAALAVVPIDSSVALANDSGLFVRRFDQLRAFDELRAWLTDWANLR